MSLRSYMLVLCGTPQLFPAMDEVFSPVARDFKRISVGPFQSIAEARECVLKPLENIGVERPSRLFDRETLSDLSDPQGLTGAMPYQIQLACHYLFRELQVGELERMALTVDVIDSILDDIGQGSELQSSAIIRSLKRLSRQELQLLRDLCVSIEPARIEDIWLFYQLIPNTELAGRDDLESAIGKFSHLGLLKGEEGLICFAGDEREALYAKYLARKRGTHFNPSPLGLAQLQSWRLATELMEGTDWEVILSLFEGSPAPDQSSSVYSAGLRLLGASGSVETGLDVSDRSVRGAMVTLYERLLQAGMRGSDVLSLATVSIAGDRMNEVLHFTTGSSDDNCADSLATNVAALAERVQGAGLSIESVVERVMIPDPEVLVTRASQLFDGKARAVLVDTHFSFLVRAYIERNVGEASMHRDWYLKLDPEPREPNHRNSLGYVFLATGRIAEAIGLFERGLELVARDENDFEPRDLTTVLLRLNMGTALIIGQDFERAQLELAAARDLAVELRVGEQQALCLIQIGHVGNEIERDEIFNPRILDVVERDLEKVVAMRHEADSGDSDNIENDV